jgi:phosphate-selective porin OprO/OprP
VGPQFVDTGTFKAESESRWGLEAAGVFGPFHAQAEWISVCTNGIHGLSDGTLVDSDGHDFDAKYVQVGYFLTGETREYDKAGARFDRIKVKKHYGDGGYGAFEVAARWSSVDLNDGEIEGGELTDWTFGVNWYLNPNTRIMLNFIHGHLKDVGRIGAIVVRFAIDF